MRYLKNYNQKLKKLNLELDVLEQENDQLIKDNKFLRNALKVSLMFATISLGLGIIILSVL